MRNAGTGSALALAGRSATLAATLAAGLAVLGSPQGATTQETRVDRVIDSIVAAEATRRGVPGMGIAIVADGKVVLQRTYGVADGSTGRAATLATPFNVASVTKPFTSAVVMQLVAEGSIGLHDRVQTHLPELPQRYRDITVYQLLTHTSGIARDLRLDNYDDPDESTYWARLDTASASANPGEQFEYSNTGYTVLGWMVERLESRPLADVLHDRLFSPLGMVHSRYRAPLADDPLRAQPHDVVDGASSSVDYVSGGFGSGGLSMSVADAAAFGVGLQRGEFLPAGLGEAVWTAGRTSDDAAVSVRMFDAPAGYGFGWFIAEYAGKRLFTHGGAIEGYSANLYHFPDERLSIVVLANSKRRDDGQAPVDAVARRVADACLAHDGCRASREVTDFRDEIRDANRRFSIAYVDGDTTRLATMYTPHAQALLPSSAAVAGDISIARLFRAPSRVRRLHHALYTERLERHGDAATEVGTWFDRTSAGEGTGRYVLTWVLKDGRWRIAADAWSDSGRP